MQVEVPPGIDRIPAFECHRDDKLCIRIREAHSGRHYPDDPPRYPVDTDGLADYLRALPKALLPVAVTQHHHEVASSDRLIGREEVAQCRMDAQRIEGVRHDRGGKHPLRGVCRGDIRFGISAEATDGAEGFRMLA